MLKYSKEYWEFKYQQYLECKYVKLNIRIFTDLIKDLTDIEIGKLVKALFEYADTEIDTNPNIPNSVWVFTKQYIDHQKELLLGRAKYGCTGKYHPNWKGGITPQNQLERHSRAYIDWRQAVFERDNFTCQFCEQKGGKLNAHHIKFWSEFPEQRFDISNGITLCEQCHKQLHRELRREKK